MSSSSASTLDFTDLEKIVVKNMKNIFIVYSFNNKGRFDSYCSKYKDPDDIIVYMKERYSDQDKDLKHRTIKIIDKDDNYVKIQQKSEYSNLISFKNYVFYNDDVDIVMNFLELFTNTKFK
jgi:hypothetical protein